VIFAIADVVIFLNYPKTWLINLYRGRRIPKVHCPRDITEKYLWRKVFDRNPVFTEIADKISAKQWLIDQGIQVRSPRLIWTGQSILDMPADLVGQDLILKPNHSSGLYLRLNEPGLTQARVVHQTQNWLRKNLWWIHGEWAYRDIEPQFLVEELVGDPDGFANELKIYMFEDRVTRSVYILNSTEGRLATAWDHFEDGSVRPSATKPSVGTGAFPRDVPPPKEALEIAKQIGRHFDHVRVDLYLDGAEIYLGEITIYNLSGYFGELSFVLDHASNQNWDLTQSWFFKTEQNSVLEWYKSALSRKIERITSWQ